MKIKLVTCEALIREFRMASALSPHVFDIEVLNFGLHNTPDTLRATIQDAIDSSQGQGYDYIILGYGLCSRGSAEITAGATPIVIPRMHDCITILLGSRARYNEEFSSNPGTYYYSPGWIERKEGDVRQGFIDDVQARNYEERFKEYSRKYGEDNARYLIDQEMQWYAHYTRAAFINMGIGAVESYRKFTQDIAADHGWQYAQIDGDMSMIRRLTDGDWDGDEFLVVQAGRTIRESFDELVLKAE